MDRDEGSIVLGWLTKLIVVLALFGLVAFDGLSVVTTRFSAEDHANTAAAAAAETWKSGHDLQKAYDAAVATVEPGETIEPTTFRVAADGGVSLVLHRDAKTLWLTKVSALAHLAKVRANGTGTAIS